MAESYVENVAAAGQREFDIPFPYLDVSHVVVEVRGTPAPYEWISPTRVRLLNATGAGDAVRIRRNTPVSQALVQFQAGATLTEADLNTAVLQTLYIQQELLDLYQSSLQAARVRLGNNLGVVTTPEQLMDELVQMSLADELLAEFRQRIADIDLNAQSIIDQAMRVTATDSRVTETRNRLNSLTGVVDGLVNIGDGAGIATLIQQESQERIEGDTAFAQLLSLIGAANGANTAFDLNLSSVRVSPTETLGQRLSALSAEDVSARALILNESQVRTTGLTALASDFSALMARVNTAEATITTDRQARVTGDSALSLRVDGVVAGVAEAKALVTQEASARATAVTAEAQARTALAAIVDQQAAAIVAEQTARANAVSAEATARQQLAARVGTAESAIQTEQQVRASETGSLATTLALLGVRNGSSTAFVLDQSKVQLGGGVTLGTRLAGIDTQLGANASAIVTEQTARTTADSSLSSQITGLTSTLNGNTAQITQLFQVTNGLSARAGVVLDVNGYATGWSLGNNGQTGYMTVVGDRFALVAPNGGTPIIPFEVIGSRARFNANVDIYGDLLVTGTITTPKLGTNAVTNGASARTIGTVQVYGSGWTTVQSVALFGSGGRIRVDWSVGLYAVSEYPQECRARILRDGAVIYEGALGQVYGVQRVYVTGESTGQSPDMYVDVPGSLNTSVTGFIVDAGAYNATHTYELQITSGAVQLYVSDRNIALLEIKR